MSSSTYFSAVDSLDLLILAFLPLLHRTPVDWKRTTSNCQKVCLKSTFSNGTQHCLCTSALGLYSYFSPLRLHPLVIHFLWTSVTFPTTFWFELLPYGILKLSFEGKDLKQHSWRYHKHSYSPSVILFKSMFLGCTLLVGFPFSKFSYVLNEL